ncbi:MBL fold metallo-hydrolase [Salinispira pacifica]
MIRVKFWGVRGSIPTPGAGTVGIGGNTACIEIRYGRDQHLIIVDAGTGIRELGDTLLREAGPEREPAPVKASIFLTHTHWDHIMGFPFFAPIYVKGTALDLYGPVTWEDESLRKVIGHQLSYQYFPVHSGELSASLRFHELREEMVELPGGMNVRTKYLNHPVLCLGYRFECEGRSVVTAYDTEPFRNLFPADPSHPDYDPDIAAEGERAAEEENGRIRAFFRNADLLIHDAQYTREEYIKHRTGWGHSSLEDAVENAVASSVRRLVLFHHDPERSDEELQSLLSGFRSVGSAHNLDIELAREGLEITLE